MADSPSPSDPISEPLSGPLSGRNVVVTGGTGALGQAVVQRLLQAGAICHVPSHRTKAGAELGAQTDESTAARLHISPGVDLKIGRAHV